jgi:hypothetical protein
MNANSQQRNTSADSAVLRWTGSVLTAEDLRQSLNGHRELLLSPRAIITPMAADHLRANGVRIVRQNETSKPATQGAGPGIATWGYAQERPDPLVRNVIQAIRRDGRELKELSILPRQTAGIGEMDIACGFARAVADCIIRGDCQGVVAFCQDPGLICCLANKVPGLRAVPAISVPQSSRACKSLGANFLAIAVSGRTFFELRQMIRTLCRDEISCSEPVAAVLKELEGPCHCQNPEPKPGANTGGCQCGGGHAHR